MYTFTTEEIKIANATSRSNGTTARNRDNSIRAVVPRFIMENVDKNKSILDYGSGKDAVHTIWLREQGFKSVIAYDFGSNFKEGVHNKYALEWQYPIVFASNVINVQSSIEMLRETLTQIYRAVADGGEFICNYCSSPRKLDLSVDEMRKVIESIFETKVERVGGTASAPIWRVMKRTEQNDLTEVC